MGYWFHFLWIFFFPWNSWNSRYLWHLIPSDEYTYRGRVLGSWQLFSPSIAFPTVAPHKDLPKLYNVMATDRRFFDTAVGKETLLSVLLPSCKELSNLSSTLNSWHLNAAHQLGSHLVFYSRWALSWREESGSQVPGWSPFNYAPVQLGSVTCFKY